jgi:hypothetical protein
VGDPMAVTRAIGPQVARVIEPFQFALPPKVHAHGIIPLRGSDDADLYFEVEGGPFHWSWFHLPAISGNVHWQGQHLSLTNIHADFYGGRAAGGAAFDFTPGPDPDYNFAFSADGADLHRLMADLGQKTNHVEGRLSGTLVITQANTADWTKTRGQGSLNLRDGLIWDIPLFGIFSAILNGVSPGLGSSRAGAADCTFAITNGVIRSDDLVIRTPTMRLDYRGTVDLQGRINARVEAGLFRDMWLVGPAVSAMFWPVTKVFEYKITGTLEKPKTAPVYLIPKILLIPFHPIRTLEDLVPEKPAPPGTNAPPAAVAPPAKSP